MRVDVDQLSGEPYRTVLGYPRANGDAIESRLDELYQIGVRSLQFDGGMSIGRLRILGKGHVGLVVRADTVRGAAALKIRRTDSPHPDMALEAALTRKANTAGVGPHLYGYTDNFILMELLVGKTIRDWIGVCKDDKALGRVIRTVLEGCWRLDCAGLDHGEIYNMSRHVIVGERITIIDFDSASMRRRTANVTSAVQGICVGMAREVGCLIDIPPKNTMVETLGRYKRLRTRASFDYLLDVLGV